MLSRAHGMCKDTEVRREMEFLEQQQEVPCG